MKIIGPMIHSYFLGKRLFFFGKNAPWKQGITRWKKIYIWFDMLYHVNQNKLTNRWQLKLLPSTKDQAYVVFYIYVVLIKDIKLRNVNLLVLSGWLFIVERFLFGLLKQAFNQFLPTAGSYFVLSKQCSVSFAPPKLPTSDYICNG